MRIRIIIGLVVVALAAFGAKWYLSRGGPEEAVFLIVVDTLRADRLSCYGYDAHETPNIDRIAAMGVQFDNAVTTGGWTVPSMGAMLTSMYPTQLGLVEAPGNTCAFKMRERRDQWEYSIALGFNTLSETMRAADYHTAAFVNQPVLINRHHKGFAQGFTEWYFPVSADTILWRDSRPGSEKPPPHAETTWKELFRADSALVASFVDWLPKVKERKLFVWVHLLTPHWPYRPPVRFGATDRSKPSELYDAEIRYTDEMVGEILGAIERAVGFDRSLIVFTSDHGEEFGEHGGKDHGHSLHRECLHVPLIMAGPQTPRGKRVASYARLLDVMPTVLRQAGVDPIDVDEILGSDITPLFDGAELIQPIYSEGMLYGSTERTLIGGGFKLMWDEMGDEYRLFDVAADPGETNDVAAQHESVVADLRAAMTELQARLSEDRVRLMREKVVEDSLSTTAERRRALNAMRALGYVNE